MGKKLYYIQYWWDISTNQYLDEHGGGSTKVFSGSGDDYQKWWVEETGDGWVLIRSHRSGNVLDSNHDGDVYTLPQNGGHFQHWKLVDFNNQTYHIQNRATGRYLSQKVWAKDAGTDKGTSSGWLGTDDCRWKFVPIQ